MPRRATSDMPPAEFRFYRDMLGYTQADVAKATGMATLRPVAAWDTERNPNADAAAFIRTKLEQLNTHVTTTLNNPLPTRITDEGDTIVELRRFTDDATLHQHHPEYAHVRHYDAYLRALAAVLAARGIRYRIIPATA